MKGLAAIFIGGVLFGIGLAVSELMKPEVVLTFLQLDDLGLALTMGAALLVTLPIYQLAPRRGAAPPLGTTFERFPRSIAPHTVIGGVIFGIGWGVAGMCPGAAIASLGAGNWPILVGLGGMLIGAYLQGFMVPAPGAVAGSRA